MLHALHWRASSRDRGTAPLDPSECLSEVNSPRALEHDEPLFLGDFGCATLPDRASMLN
jgi:hypothetical protein